MNIDLLTGRTVRRTFLRRWSVKRAAFWQLTGDINRDNDVIRYNGGTKIWLIRRRFMLLILLKQSTATLCTLIATFANCSCIHSVSSIFISRVSGRLWNMHESRIPIVETMQMRWATQRAHNSLQSLPSSFLDTYVVLVVISVTPTTRFFIRNLGLGLARQFLRNYNYDLLGGSSFS